MSRVKAMWLIAMGGLAALPAGAQQTTWQVVAGESAQVLSADLPAGTARDFVESAIGDTGRRQFGLRVTSPSSQQGYWANRGGKLVRVTQPNVVGPLGPGRAGAEAAHVFLAINTGGADAAPDGQRSFVARAGDPAATLNATYGIWRWNGSGNVEIARASTDGVLGPGLGAGWVFPNNSLFAAPRTLPGGEVLLVGEVSSPTGVETEVFARHVPGQGNLPCLRVGATEPALSPGLVAGGSFSGFTSGLERSAVTTTGRIFARLPASGAREGIWELCDGAPRAIAVDEESGPRGPDVGAATAEFTSFGFDAPIAAGIGELVFFADWRIPPASSRPGLFRHDGVSNRGIAYNEASGYYGPNWLDATWRSFDVDSLDAAGAYSVFEASVDTGDGGTPTGLWRVRAGDRPELVALLGIVGAPHEPEPGRTWRSFDAIAVLGTGDIVLEASSNPNATRDLWLLRPGQSPRRLLSLGTSIAVATTQGSQQAVVTGFDPANGGSGFGRGSDTWIGADGTLFLRVSSNLGSLLISTRLDVPDPETVFISGFE